MSDMYPNLNLIGYVLLDKMTIANANAISSPLTYGTPAVSGFVGAVHALSRKLTTPDCKLDGVLIACFDCQVQAYREHAYQDYTFVQTRNPIKKDGTSASIVEEGRVHLVVSLLVGVYRHSRRGFHAQEALCERVRELAYGQRFAGGNVTHIKAVDFVAIDALESCRTKLMPSFVLMDATDTLKQMTQELQEHDPTATALDALLQTATLHHIPNADNTWQTTSFKKGRGYLVPIPIGFAPISPLFDKGVMQNARHDYPAQYVESVYSLGKWVFAGQVPLADALWYAQYDNDLYTFVQ